MESVFKFNMKKKLISYLYFREQLATAQSYGCAWLPARSCGIPRRGHDRLKKTILQKIGHKKTSPAVLSELYMLLCQLGEMMVEQIG